MRILYRRVALGLLAAGLVGSTTLGMGRQTEPPPLDGPTAPPAATRDLPNPFRLASATVSTLHTDPSVSLTWTGPAHVRIHQSNEYTLTVRNVCDQPVQKVTVQVRVPQGSSMVDTTPRATPVGNVYVWDLGILEPGASVPLGVTLRHATRGDTSCQAWVTFTGSSAMSVVVHEPKIEAQVIAPKEVVLGDPIPVQYKVRNSGDIAVEWVESTMAQSHTVIGPGAAAVQPVAHTAPQASTASMGAMEPNEAKSTTFRDRADAGGIRTYTVTYRGADGLEAKASADVRILVPKLEAELVGPHELLIGQKARYTIRYRNTGDLPLTDVSATCQIPTGVRVVDGTEESASSRMMTFVRPEALAPGQVAEFGFEAIAQQPGTFTYSGEVTSSREQAANITQGTRVDGIPALRMEVADLVDPIEKGNETTYEIRLTNTGSRSDTNLVVRCQLPPELVLVSMHGPVRGYEVTDAGLEPGVKAIAFEPITELAPKTEAVLRVKVKAVANGDARFKATVTSQHLATPVIKEESTRIYGE